MKVLVTGGAGFVGSHLTDRLLKEGHEVLVIDNLSSGHKENLKPHVNLTFVQKDIRNKQDIESYFKDVEWIFHLAALADIVPSIEKPREYFETNVDGTFNVLECAKENGTKRFIYSASSSCYGIPNKYPTKETSAISPQYPYALTKHMGEELVMHWAKVYNLPSLSLRFFNVYGPRARTTGSYGAVFGVFLAQKFHNKPFTVIGDGKQSRDFTYVTDVVDALITAASSNITAEIFNVGSDGHYSINELTNLLGGKVTFIPKRPGEPDCTFADISKIRQMLSWTPKVSFREGVNNLLSEIEAFKNAPLWNEQSIEKATEKWFTYLSKKVETCS